MGGATRFQALAAALIGMVVWLLAQGIASHPHPSLIDNDSWMHVVRLHEVLARGAWNHGITLRDGAPSGYALHWTMPLDLLALALASPLAGTLGWHGAVDAVAPYVGPVTGMGLLAAVAWAAAPLGRGVPVLAVLLSAAAPPVIGYGLLGICDHHLLIEAVGVAAIAAGWRLATGSDSAARGAVAGLLGGVGLWVALEAMPLVLLSWALGTGAALWRPQAHRRSALAQALALASTTAVALALDQPADPATTDRLGPVVLALALLCAVLTLVTLSQAERPPRRRVMVVGAVAAVAGLLWLALYFGAKQSSPALEPAVAAWFWGGIAEFASPLSLHPAMAIMVLAQPAMAVLAAGFLLWRSQGRERLMWAAALAVSVALLAAGAACARMTLHAAVPDALILAVAISRLFTLALRPGLRVARVVAPVLAIALPYAAPLALGSPAALPKCPVDEAARLLAAEPAPLVLADINLSPPLLYKAPNTRTLSGPYHVNPQGLSALYAFATAGEAEGHAIVGHLGATHVLVCPPGMPDGPLRRRLLEGRAPDWLEPMNAGPVRLYRVR